jgi:hypothetical protein
VLVAAAWWSSPASAQNTAEERLRKLEEQFELYKKESAAERAALQKQIDELKSSRAESAPSNAQALGDAVAELQARLSSLAERQAAVESARGQKTVYIDVSWDSLFTAGTSQATETQLTTLQGGGHDPSQRGTSFVNGELSLQGAVDPYFRGDVHIVSSIDRAGETVVELEEATVTTTQLPADLQLKAGHFFTEFGRINRQHPHEWDFVDQPIVNTRMFGGDGLRAPGGRLSWLAPMPFFMELQTGIQNARGETATSFLGTDTTFDSIKGSSGAAIPGTVGGRPWIHDSVQSLEDLLYTERILSSFDFSDASTVVLGGSALFGPNATGGSGRTQIYGVDFLYKWKPLDNENGWPFVKVQAESMWRHMRAAAVRRDLDGDAIAEVFPSARFDDWGAYAQAIWGFARPWAAGFRIETVDGDGASTGGIGSLDRRTRLSPNLTYFPSEFSRIRLQANFDRAQELRDQRFASIWLQFEVLFGAHGAHKF